MQRRKSTYSEINDKLDCTKYSSARSENKIDKEKNPPARKRRQEDFTDPEPAKRFKKEMGNANNFCELPASSSKGNTYHSEVNPHKCRLSQEPNYYNKHFKKDNFSSNNTRPQQVFHNKQSFSHKKSKFTREEFEKTEKTIERLLQQSRSIHVQFFNKYLNLTAHFCGYNVALALYKNIDQYRVNANIITHNTMLSLWGQQQKYDKAEDLYRVLKENHLADITTHNTMLTLLGEQQKYDKAEDLYRVLKENHRADITTHTTMLTLLGEQQKYDKTEDLYEELKEKRLANIITHTTMSKWLMTDFTAKKLAFTQNVFTHLINTLALLPKNTPDYRKRRTKVIARCHALCEKLNGKLKKNPACLAYKQVLQQQILVLLNEFKNEIATSDKRLSLTLLEAWLLNLYFPDYEATPTYNALNSEQLNQLQQRAWSEIDPELHSFSTTMDYTIDKIDSQGHKTDEYQLNESIYHRMGAGYLGPYAIVDFNKPVKASKLPLFIRYHDQIYRTDVLGGSKWKTQISAEKFGQLIAIPLAAGDFFKHWETSEESYIYGQPAFLPEKVDSPTYGLQGEFKVGVIPDALSYAIQAPFIVQDGWGYIKKSVYLKMNIPASPPITELKSSPLTYQALQSYEASGYKDAVDEVANWGAETLLQAKTMLARGEKLTSDMLTPLYASLSAGLPSYMGTAIPVQGETLVLPQLPAWKAAEAGVLVGRNPYSAKKRLQAVPSERICFSERLSKLKSFQYRLTGYENQQGKLIGRFFKGMLGVIDDEDWPAEYQNCDMMVSAKDQKLAQDWLSAETKQTAQNPALPNNLTLTGSLSVTESIPLGKTIGIPASIAKPSAGDYDGDTYNVVPIETLPAVYRLVAEGSEDHIPNPKPPKTFTLRKKVGNYQQMINSRLPLLECWNTVQSVFYALPDAQRICFIKEMVETHALTDYLGEHWRKKLGIAENKITDEAIVTAEIQLGVKFGEDMAKTKAPLEVLQIRLHAYEKHLRRYNPGLSVPYGKGLKNHLKQLLEEPELTAAEQQQALTERLNKIHDVPKESRIKNMVGKSQWALTHLFFQPSATATTAPKKIIDAKQMDEILIF